jgi:hypothetical protein
MLATQGLFAFQVEIQESDLFVVCDRDLRAEAQAALAKARSEIESYIGREPDFRRTLAPIAVADDAPQIIRKMAEAAQVYGVGSMAAVAGAVAQEVGEAISGDCSHLIIENGGDIYIKSDRKVTLGVYAGEKSPFTGNVRFQVDPKGGSLGVCTSSGKVGHSLSFGRSDAVVTVAESAYLADAAATAIGNLIKTPHDVQPVLDKELEKNLLNALIIIIGDKMGVFGDVNLI